MKKVTTILIQGTLFTIDEDAYKMLNDYIKSINKHFEKYEDDTEITSDIESRIAEKFQNEIISNTHKTITQKDVETLIKAMGTIEDFTRDELDDEINEESSQSAKHLYRDPDQAMIAGICSGIGAYFSIDPLVIRILFILIVLFGGSGILLYIVLWILLPQAKTPLQKLQMRGDATTLSALEKNLKDGLNDLPVKSTKLAKYLNKQSHTLASFVSWIGKIIRFCIRILGGIFTLSFIFTTFWLTIFALIVLFRMQYSYFETTSQEGLRQILSVVSDTDYNFLVISVYLITLIPLLILCLASMGITLWKNLFKLPVVISLCAIWLLALGTFTIIGVKDKPLIEEKTNLVMAQINIQEQSSLITKEVQTENFNGIFASGNNTIILKQGPKNSVVVSGSQLQVNQLHINAHDNNLYIDQDFILASNQKICLFECFTKPTITITSPNFTSIYLSNNVSLSSDGDSQITNTENLTFNLQNNAKADIKLNGNSVGVSLSNLANLKITGTVNDLHAEVFNHADLDMKDTTTKEAMVLTKNLSFALLNVTDYLNASANDMSDISYYGAAKVEKYEDGRFSHVSFIGTIPPIK
jgi:phage shock protein PspC (stress-responsive transcriptional regulator)